MDAADEERRLVEKAVGGDQKALFDLFEQNRAAMLAVAKPLLPGQVRAWMDHEDLVEDLFLDLAERGAIRTFSWQNDHSVLDWLTKVLKRQILMLVRAEHASTRKHREAGAERLDRLAAKQSRPSTRAGLDESIAEIEEILGHLPEEIARALRLFYVDGLPGSVCAARMKMTPSSFRVFLMRARVKFQQWGREPRRSKTSYAPRAAQSNPPHPGPAERRTPN